MAIEPGALSETVTKLRRFPVFPSREDMQNPIYLYRPSHMTALAVFLGNRETTLVLGEVPISSTIRHRAKVRIPDFVLEVASITSLSDMAVSITLPLLAIDDLKVLANKRDIPYKSLMKIYLAERV
jgi:hypothetical protein